MFENLLGSDYVWESLEKQCKLGNPWWKNVCLGFAEETMYVWKPVGKLCMFENPLKINVSLGIHDETMYV